VRSVVSQHCFSTSPSPTRLTGQLAIQFYHSITTFIGEMSPSLNGPGPASLDLPGPTDTDLAEFASRFEHVQQYEDERAKVMAVRLAAKRHFILHELTVLQEMMTRYEYMHQQYQVRYLTVQTAYETLTNFLHPQRRH
jgi:hypothetical protein